MKINIIDIGGGTIRLREVFNSEDALAPAEARYIVLETEEGNQFVICMRGNGLEIGLEDIPTKHDGPERYLRWFVAKDGNIKERTSTPSTGSASTLK